MAILSRRSWHALKNKNEKFTESNSILDQRLVFR